MTWLLTDGFVWSGRTGRLRYLGALIILGFGWIALAVATFDGVFTGNARIAAFAALVLLVIPLVGFRLRRLHDIGLSGFWTVLVAVPYVNLVFELLMLTVPSRDIDYRPAPWFAQLLGYGLVVAVMMLVLSRMYWHPYWIPSASMKPTLMPGDYVLAHPMGAAPERGDLIVFRNGSDGKDYVKRVIGLPGDRVQMRADVVQINDQPVGRSAPAVFTETYRRQGPGGTLPRCREVGVPLGGVCTKDLFTETLPGGRSYETLDVGLDALDNAGPFEVPAGHVFVLGDNRDNSMDSRLSRSAMGLGFIPEASIRGRVERVVISAAGRSFAYVWAWRPDRIWKAVE